MTNDRKVRVFISSTFRDMHAERDHLVTVVFPELRERCERLGLEFFDVDLRWGVPDKNVDGEKANSWEYCRKWIDEAKPFFLCLLGQRYGWVPEPHELKDELDQQAQAAERRSITDMEVRRALEHEAHSRRCFFYLRQAKAPDSATEYVDPPDLLIKLDALKDRVRACGRPVWDYPCQWKGGHFTGMEAFGQRVLDDLWSAILRDPRFVGKEVWKEALGGTNPNTDPRFQDETRPVPEDLAEKLVLLAKPAPKDPLEAEREQMATFAASRLRWFQGRIDELKDLIRFINSPADEQIPRLALIAAQPGQGKSALIAKLHQILTTPSLHDSTTPFPPLFLVSHFVGATEKSSSAYNLVRRLNDELDASGIAFPERPVPEGQTREEVKLDFNSLCQRLSERLGDYAGERRIVILLDALNQLDDGHGLVWLPYRLGPGVRLVASCIEESFGVPPSGGHPNSPDRVNAELRTPAQKVLAALDSRRPSPLRIPLGGLSDEDVKTIVTSHLEEYCKQLDPEHIAVICDGERLPQTRNPLYLLVMLAELRTLGGNDMNQVVPKLIEGMATKYPDTVSLFDWMLQRMEEAEGFGREAVASWCRYLALGRAGMASRELADLLKRTFQSDEAARTAQRIERGLRRYLQARGETLDFFHRQLRQAVMGRYAREREEIRGAHREIAEYFFDIANPNREGPWRGEERHALSELPHHQIQAAAWPELIATLETLFFLEAKTTAGMAFDLVEDFAAAQADLPMELVGRERLPLLEKALRRDIHFIARHAADYPQALFQCLWNSAWWHDSPESLTHNVSQAAEKTFQPLKLWERLQFPWRIRNAHSKTVENNAIDQNTQGSSISWLLEQWRSQRNRHRPSFHWLRSLQAPFVSLASIQIAILRGHKPKVDIDGLFGVEDVAISSDGSLLASAGWDTTVRIWDTQTGQEVAVLCGHDAIVTTVAFSSDGRHLVSGSWDNTVRLWEVQTGQERLIFRGHEKKINRVTFSKNDSYVISASADGTVKVWDSSTSLEVVTLRGRKPVEPGSILMEDFLRGMGVTSLAISPDGRILASGGQDMTVRLWDTSTWSPLTTLHGHTGAVRGLAFSRNGAFLASASSDKTVRLWCANTNVELFVFIGHEGEVNGVTFKSNNQTIASASSDGTVRIWNLDDDREDVVLRGHESDATCAAFFPDGSFLASASRDNTVRLWNPGIQSVTSDSSRHGGKVTCVAFSHDSSLLASASLDNTVMLWDAQTGRERSVLRGHQHGVYCVVFSPDDRRLASASDDGTVRIWDVRSGRLLRVFAADIRAPSWEVSPVNSVTYSPDGRFIASGSGMPLRKFDNVVRLWNARNGRVIATLRGHDDAVTCLAFRPDGQILASGSCDGTVRLWNARFGDPIATLRGHEHPIKCLIFSPDGKQLASGSEAGRGARLWDVRRRECLEEIQGYFDPGDYVRAIGAELPLHYMWRGESVIARVFDLTPVAYSTDGLTSVACSPDGRLWAGAVGNHFVLLKLEGGV